MAAWMMKAALRGAEERGVSGHMVGRRVLVGWAGCLRVVVLAVWLATHDDLARVVNQEEVRGRHQGKLLAEGSDCMIKGLS